MSQIFRLINWSSFVALIIYPLFLLCLTVAYGYNYGIGLSEVLFVILGYYGSNIAVGIGLHRLWSHNSYKTNSWVEFILMLLTAGTLQGPVLSWASNHYRHHTYTDKELDPHTPLKFENRILGFIWSHVGWMLIGEGSYKSIDRVTMVKLGRNNILRFQLKHYWSLAIFMNTVVPALIGYVVGGSIFYAYVGYLFIGLGRAIQQQATFCVNSLCHFAGTKDYYKGTAGDIWWMALFLLGENYHNFHHAFPSDYRNGVKWYHFDVHKWIIYCMSLLGLAWDLDRTSQVRIQAKMHEAKEYMIKTRESKWQELQSRAEVLLSQVCSRASELESLYFSDKMRFSMQALRDGVQGINSILGSSVEFTEKSSERVMKLITKKLMDYEKSLEKLSIQISRAIERQAN